MIKYIFLILFVLIFIIGCNIPVTQQVEVTEQEPELVIEKTIPEHCIEILSHNKRIDKHGWITVSGEVKNNCESQEFSHILFTIYDVNNNFVKGDFTFGLMAELPAGKTTSFDKTWFEDYVINNFDHYKIEGGN